MCPTELAPRFGEDEVKELCRRFNLQSRLILNAFRDYVDDFGRKMPDDLQPLVNCTKVIPCSTAECERGFSHMNIIITDTRSKLLLSHVSSLMFIKLHVPPLSCWKPTNYAYIWLRKHRSTTDTRTQIVSAKTVEEDPLLRFF